MTTTRIRRDDEDALSVTFDVDTRGCDNNSSTLRKYVGFTDVREVSDDALAIRMHGVAQIDRATSFASRMIREVMLGAMHSQMRASPRGFGTRAQGMSALSPVYYVYNVAG